MQKDDTMQMTKPHTDADSAGFTMLEVLMAVTIFALGLLAVAAMTTSGIRTNKQSTDMTLLGTHAQDKIEELRSADWDDTLLDEGTGKTDSPAPVGYTLTWDVTDMAAPSPLEGAKSIAVTASAGGKTITLTTVRIARE